HRQRRLLVLDIAEAVVALASSGPTLVTLEDLHWADDLTLEILWHVARLARGAALLVVGTYRSDELYPRTPMRLWRTRILEQRLAEELSLERLSREETRAITEAILGPELPLSVSTLTALHERSDGIPLHIEELLGVMRLDAERGERDDLPRRDARRSGQTMTTLRDLAAEAVLLPETLLEAILVRASTLSAGARGIAEVAAVVGRSVDAEFLQAVAGRSGPVVDRALAELVARHFLRPGLATGTYDFRHALIRDALYGQIGERTRALLHRRVASEAVRRGADPAYISAHFELGGSRAEAFEHAVTAAREASRLSAHRESTELHRRALRNLPADVGPLQVARILADYGTEAAAADENAAAAEAFEAARATYLAAGAVAEAAALVPSLVAVRHLLGASLEERVSLLERGLAEIDAAPQQNERTSADLLAGLSAAYMLDRRLDEAIEYGEAARTLARRLGEATIERHAEASLGSALVFAGRMDEGWRLLERTIEQALALQLEADAARGFRMIGSCASVLVEYDRAEHWLGKGIAYAERVELWNHRHYMAAHLAHVAWATGDWGTAERLARQALADGRGGITTRITALHVLGYVALGRGQFDAARHALEEARELGERMAELQRLSPALWGLAETARLDGRLDDSAAHCEAGYRASAAVADAAYLFPFLLTGVRTYWALGRPGEAEAWFERVASILRQRAIPGTLPAVDHAAGLLLAGRGGTRAARARIEAAADGWRRSRRSWEGTWAWVDLARVELRSKRLSAAIAAATHAVSEARRLGSPPLEAAASEVLRTASGRRPAVQKGAAIEAWAPLTTREYEVALRIAAGATNAEIASGLGIAPKTVSAHVEHIMNRLGVARRAEIAAWVTSIEVERRRIP
ncbi:MAG TPA: LuxR C-terminal-related transcriptional regulator, partial [Candidatus Limnocylindrales bacterium]|nr:LuxR C-terminal-related transcriptional regulator [Candidatus Limnocylindrales bacterium]